MPSLPRRLRPVAALLLALSMLPNGSAGAAIAKDGPASIVASTAVLRPAPIIDHAGTDSARTRSSRIVDSTGLIAAASMAASARVAVPTPSAKSEPTGKAKTTASTSKAKTSKAKTSSSAAKTKTKAAPSYRGRNHVWMPALGISRSTTFYSCSNTSYPGNRVYRWGCAGSNNVYLFGHASSVFKPLHDAYVRGRLRKGMTLYYANSAGKVGKYRVSWWRVTTPEKGGFAYASLSRPSVTLQTCLGARSQYRLIVRLTKVG